MSPTEESLHSNFRIFFDQHYQGLCSYAFSFLKDEESCEDIVQDIFIKIWLNRQDLIGSEQLKFYVFSSVRNNCLTRLQKNKKYRVVEMNDEDEAGEIIIKLDPEDEKTNPTELIAKALDRLPPKCREVFLLSRIGNLTYLQIADNLGISIKTVENQMGKALKILRNFAKENRIYFIVALCIIGGNYLNHHIGVFIEKWYY
ncbi:MAG: RNA polymerase sigma-70 factor [Bacteroidota bacterium]|nr:RNA polymerase sigma-70 factor [Bacteroidota bacterium]